MYHPLMHIYEQREIHSMECTPGNVHHCHRHSTFFLKAHRTRTQGVCTYNYVLGTNQGKIFKALQVCPFHVRIDTKANVASV